jgi:hypothetical protein
MSGLAAPPPSVAAEMISGFIIHPSLSTRFWMFARF